MNTTAVLFEIEIEGDTAVITPQSNLREPAWHEIEAEGEEVLRFLSTMAIRNVVVDFARMDYCGSTALGFFVGLWRLAEARGGHLAVCNVSPHEQEVLAVAGFAGTWPVYASRAEAIAGVNANP